MRIISSLICFMYMFLGHVHAQPLDTSGIQLNSKLLIFESSWSDYSKDFIFAMMESNVQMEFLESKGTEHYIFYSITTSSQDGFYRINKKDSTKELLPFWKYDHEYCFGYNTLTGKILRLKGFLVNDFDQLYYVLKSMQTFNVSDRKIRKKFENKEIWVEKIDLLCLWNYYFKRNKEKYKHCLGYPTDYPSMHW